MVCPLCGGGVVDGGEVFKCEKGNSICLDLGSKFFTKIEYAENFNAGGGEGSEGGGLVETEKTYRLSGKFCFKEAFGKKLTKVEATKILEGQEVKIKRVSKKTNAPYEVTIWLEDGGKLGSSFN
ncbi:MAG: topoisomerase [Campylobacterota bacterium]|nr:topoisomerase [Campylobacterota bacterium]